MKLFLLWQLFVVSAMSQGPGLIYAVGAGNPAQDLPNISGGYRADSVTGVAVDAAGNAYITGNTYSPAFPAFADTGPPQFTPPPKRAFVAKLNPDGSRYMYTLLIEGATSNAIAVDPSGAVVIAGETYGTIAGAPASLSLVVPGWRKAFIAKLNVSGTALVFAAYLGGSADSTANSVVLDSGGNVYVAGGGANDFPVTPSAYRSTGSGCNVYVSKLNPGGTALTYSALLGGTACTYVNSLAVDRAGSAYVAGYTVPGSTGFVKKLSPLGDTLLYAATLNAEVKAIAVDTSGNAYAAGSGFVTKMNSAGNTFLYSTNFDAAINAIAVDSAGNTYFSGSSMAGLPIVNALQPSFFGGVCTDWTSSGSIPTGYSTCSDAFVAGLNASGKALLFSTYLSGYGKDAGAAIALDAQANIYVGGLGMLSMAETNPLSNNGSAFVVKLGGNIVLPYFTRESITNAASFSSGLVRPGGAATMFCANLNGTSGVKVKVNGVEAPLYAVIDTGQQQQINFQVPFEASTQDPPERMNVELSQNVASAFLTGARVYTTPPGVFTTDGNYGAIQHGSDYSLVTPATPAERGEVVIVYATGLGRVAPAVPSGVPAPLAPLSFTTGSITVMIGGQRAEILYSGLAPGYFGLYQLNVRVPENIESGDQNLVISFPPVQDGYSPFPRPHMVRVDSRPVLISLRNPLL